MRRILSPILWIALSLSWSAQAWDQHASLMPGVLATLPASTIELLKRPIPAPCADEDLKIFERLRAQLGLNPNRKFSELLGPTVQDCKKPTSAYEILGGAFVDDPDHGMDQDLPDAQDPRNERTWMGGDRGPTSQGFRHMYFGGWKPAHPIETFQLPLHAVGQAPERAQLVSEAARELLRGGHPAWGWRVLAWSLHYIQDLAQPFHSVQIVTPRILPWDHLFNHFVQDTTRIVGNYHWAYEGITLHELQLGDASPLRDCLKDPEQLSNFLEPARPGARELALSITRGSVELGAPLGRSMLALFTTRLKDPDVDLTQSHGVPDYERLARTPSPERDELDAVTCRALANAYRGSHRMIEAFLK